jgi:hypothetical protein
VSGWQSIHTAPTHKSIIVCVWWSDRPEHPYVGEAFLDWDRETWRWQNGKPIQPEHTNPTHWQDLPNPPTRE